MEKTIKLRYGVPTAVNIKITVFWNVMVCTLVKHSKTLSAQQERTEVITTLLISGLKMLGTLASCLHNISMVDSLISFLTNLISTDEEM